MLSTSLYLLKVSAYVIAFYIPFTLILRRTTFFTVNRVYLVAGLSLSFVLPLIETFNTISVHTLPKMEFMEPIGIATESIRSLSPDTGTLFTLVDMMSLVYVVGISVQLVRTTLAVHRILRLKRKGETSVSGNLTVVKANTPVPFSFLNNVFLPKTVDDPGILAHEAAHVTQCHWIDLFLIEIGAIVLWFNPVMIFYKRSLKQQHEYLADNAAIHSGIDLGEYLLSIRQQIELAIPSVLISEFYFQSIKKRIDMLTSKRTSSFALAMYAMVLPMIAFLLVAFSTRKHFQPIESVGLVKQDKLSLSLPIERKHSFLLESGYGERMHPVLGVKRLHTGIDLTTAEGIPVVASEEGVVTTAKLADAWGNIIIVQHDDTYSTSYSHLKSMNVKPGDKVTKGQVIGLVGHTGMSSKDHLHFELLKNGTAVDPMSFLPEIK
jgi:hypothetical protein